MPEALRELRLVCGVGGRGPDRLDRLEGPGAPGLEAIVAALRAAPPAGAVTLWGGEPTTRADLPALLSALGDAPRLGLHSDGLALTKASTLAALHAAGLRRVRVELHAMSGDGGFEAHDWLMKRPGAGRRAALALKASRAAGLETEAEITLTRPTTPLLVDTVRGLIALGVQRLRVRRLSRRGPAASEFLALSPRLGLAEPELVAAAELAARHRVPLTFHGFPACALGEAAGRLVLAEEEPLLASEPAWVEALRAYALPRAPGCGTCAGRRCDGAPEDYVARFGWAEIRSEDASTEPTRPEEDARAESDPPPRAGRFPATRLLSAVEAAHGAELPSGPAPLPSRMALRLAWPMAHACPLCRGPQVELGTPSRVFRQDMVALRSQGARELELIGPGALHHPALVELLRDAVVLGFEAVQVSGDARALAERPRRELSRLRRLRPQDQLSLTLYGPNAASHDAHVGEAGAFAATLTALARLEELTRASVRLCAVLHQAGQLAGFAEAWESGALPGPMSFRLALAPGELEPLVAATARSSEAAREVLSPLLPRCLHGGPWRATEPGTAPLFDPAAPRGVGALPLLGDHASTPLGPCGGRPSCSSLSGCPGRAISCETTPPSDRT